MWGLTFNEIFVSLVTETLGTSCVPICNFEFSLSELSSSLENFQGGKS